MIAVGVAGGVILLISCSICFYCWRRAALLARANSKTEQVVVGKTAGEVDPEAAREANQDVGLQGHVVTGQVVDVVDSQKGGPNFTTNE